MKARAIIEALLKREAKVKNKTLGEQLAATEAKATLAEMLVAVEIDTLGNKLPMVNTEALVDTLAYRVKSGCPVASLQTCQSGRRDTYIGSN